MAYQYDTIDGQRVEKNVATAFRKMAAAFKKRWGLTLHITSGTRTRAEQAELYRKWKNGTGNLAAAPGYSNHEEGGPIGPRALDLRDSGTDPGVAWIGSERSNWLAKEAAKHGFKNAGHFFSPREGWHYEYTGVIGRYPASTGGGSSPVVIPTQEDSMFVAIVRKKDWYLVVGGKACLLGAASGARNSGAPILEFVDDWAVNQLKTIVSGIK